ncbi:MAG: Fe(2+)-trafficking protein [Planctomycetota bacterium]
MPDDDKIVRFRKLVEMDPDDATSHFTLGTALAEAGEHTEAAESFLNAIAINKDFSKAFQLAGRSLIASGDTDRAIRVLERGHEAAARQGDLMPKKAIEGMLHDLGKPVADPQIEVAAPGHAPKSIGGGGHAAFIDRKTGQPGTRMDRPPFRGKLGEWIHQHVSREQWNVWLGQGTKIINELRLDLSSEEGSTIYDLGMLLYFNIDAGLYTELTGQEPPSVGPDYREMLARVLNADPDTLASFKGELREMHGGAG